MQRLTRFLPSRTILVAVIATLLVGGAGTATAAKLITGKQIRNGSLQFGDLSKKARQKLKGNRGRTGTQGTQGAQGAQGAKGDKGDKGDAGTSVFSSTIPSGQTVTGAWGESGQAAGFYFITVSLPVAAPADLTSGNINFAPGVPQSDDDASCTGTGEVPTAPAGKVCLYPNNTANVTDLGGYTDGESTPRYGFSIRVDGNANMDARGLWAYTAP